MSYIDTSVLVAYYCPEPLSNAAERAIRQADRPTISALVEVEFCSALAIKMRTGDMDMESAQRILSCFRMHIADRLFTIVPVAAREYAAACRVCMRVDGGRRSHHSLTNANNDGSG